jgi:hypothetical protein
MRTDTKPNSIVEKERWFNQMDETCGFLSLSISLDLLFHIEYEKTPNEVWTKIEGPFWKYNVLREHQLQNELISLSLRNFDNIEDVFSQLKSLLLQLKLCGIYNMEKEEKLILSIVFKMGPKYSFFVSTFHATKPTLGTTWRFP